MKFPVPDKVKSYLDLIDEKYLSAKFERISRVDVKWGGWSREMNLDTKSEEGLAYKYLFVYWVIKSQLLELHFKTKFKQGKKKQLAREAKAIKTIILSGEGPTISNSDVQRRLFGSVLKVQGRKT